MNTAPSEPRPRRRLAAAIAGGALGPLLALVAVIALFGAADQVWGEGRFFATDNLLLPLLRSAPVAIAALGMTLIIISGGIDLSAGTAVAFSLMVLASGLYHEVGVRLVHGESTRSLTAQVQSAERDLARPAGNRSQQREELDRLKARLDDLRADAPRWHWLTVSLSLVGCVIAGVLCGAVNGLLINQLKIVPFIVTLGTMSVYLGLAKMVGGGTTLNVPGDAIPDWIRELLWPEYVAWIVLPVGIWLSLILAAIVAFVLHRTVFGRYVFALGSNEATARLCGVPIARTRVMIYALAGFFVGIAAVMQLSRVPVGDPTAGTGLELRIIAAVVIGGASLSGGRGSIVGTLAGATMMGVIEYGCVQLKLRDEVINVVIGAVIIVAAYVDQLRLRRLGLQA